MLSLDSCMPSYQRQPGHANSHKMCNATRLAFGFLYKQLKVTLTSQQRDYLTSLYQ